MFYNENVNYLLCSCTNPIFEKNPIHELLTKILSANKIAGFSKQLIAQKKLIKQPSFFHVNVNVQKSKVDWIFLLLDMVKNGCDQSGLRTLNLVVSEEWTDVINLFLHGDKNSQKLKVDQKIFGCHGRKWAWPVCSWDSKIGCI